MHTGPHLHTELLELIFHCCVYRVYTLAFGLIYHYSVLKCRSALRRTDERQQLSLFTVCCHRQTCRTDKGLSCDHVLKRLSYRSSSAKLDIKISVSSVFYFIFALQTHNRTYRTVVKFSALVQLTCNLL